MMLLLSQSAGRMSNDTNVTLPPWEDSLTLNEIWYSNDIEMLIGELIIL